jgi:hypothetical protein
MSGIPKGGMTKVRGSAARGTAKEALTNASSWCSQPASTSRRADCRFLCEHCRMPASISERCQRAVNRDEVYARARRYAPAAKLLTAIHRWTLAPAHALLRRTRSADSVTLAHKLRTLSLCLPPGRYNQRMHAERQVRLDSYWTPQIHPRNRCMSTVGCHYALCDIPAHMPPLHIPLLVHLGKLHLHPRNASISGPQAAAYEMRASCQDSRGRHHAISSWNLPPRRCPRGRPVRLLAHLPSRSPGWPSRCPPKKKNSMARFRRNE